MVDIDLKLLKQLREETFASISDCRLALEETDGHLDKALQFLQKRSAEKAEKKAGRETGEGIVEPYIHQNGKVGALVCLLCETDFVARTDEFKVLAHNIALQIVAMKPENKEELLKQEFIKDASLTIAELIKQAIGKLGENITLFSFTRMEV